MHATSKPKIERGGLLLWVHTRTNADEERALAILEKHSAEKVHVHRLPLEVLVAEPQERLSEP